MKKISRQFHHYLPLLGILAAGIIGFSLFSFDKSFQAALILGVSSAYVGWGVIHHYQHQDLHFEVVIEYLAVAFLGLVIIFSIIFRA